MKILHRSVASRTVGLIVFIFTVAAALPLQASGGTDYESRLFRLEQLMDRQQAAASNISSGDNAWVLTSTALVLLMTAPGLILLARGDPVFIGGRTFLLEVIPPPDLAFVICSFLSLLPSKNGVKQLNGRGRSDSRVRAPLDNAGQHCVDDRLCVQEIIHRCRLIEQPMLPADTLGPAAAGGVGFTLHRFVPPLRVLR